MRYRISAQSSKYVIFYYKILFILLLSSFSVYFSLYSTSLFYFFLLYRSGSLDFSIFLSIFSAHSFLSISDNIFHSLLLSFSTTQALSSSHLLSFLFFYRSSTASLLSSPPPPYVSIFHLYHVILCFALVHGKYRTAAFLGKEEKKKTSLHRNNANLIVRFTDTDHYVKCIRWTICMYQHQKYAEIPRILAKAKVVFDKFSLEFCSFLELSQKFFTYI